MPFTFFCLFTCGHRWLYPWATSSMSSTPWRAQLAAAAVSPAHQENTRSMPQTWIYTAQRYTQVGHNLQLLHQVRECVMQHSCFHCSPFVYQKPIPRYDGEEYKSSLIPQTVSSMSVCAAHVDPAWAWFIRPGSAAAGWAGEPGVATLESRGGATCIGWKDGLEDVTSFHAFVFLQ